MTHVYFIKPLLVITFKCNYVCKSRNVCYIYKPYTYNMKCTTFKMYSLRLFIDLLDRNLFAMNGRNAVLVRKCFLWVFLLCFIIFPLLWLYDSERKVKQVIYDQPLHVEGFNRETTEIALLSSILDEINAFRCDKLLVNDPAEVQSAISFLERHNHTFQRQNDDSYIVFTRDCDRFKTTQGYILQPVTKEENAFPLAYSILFHRNVEQLERLLRAIYRPQNQYCIHVDKKTPKHVLNAVQQISSCFPNVFLTSQQETVIYASSTRLLADIRCMKDLVKRDTKWNYLLNFASSEFPIMTNHQLVQILKQFNGSNDIHETVSTMDDSRFRKKHLTYIDPETYTGHIIHTDEDKDPPPHGLIITKGNAYNVFSRAFVQWVLTNKFARDLLAWSLDTLTPDEHYWATLNNLHSNPFLKTPGGYYG